MRIQDLSLLTLVLACLPAAAQWDQYPTPGTPRTADGKPNLTAPAPKAADGKTDLTGIWQRDSGRFLSNIAVDSTGVVLFPAAEALYQKRKAALGAGRPSEVCLPHGIPDAMTVGTPIKFVQTPQLLLILHEEFNHFRQVLTDGRSLPSDPNPSWFGYSVGKWEGNTLVIDTSGFNDQSWLDDLGHPHSDALRITERYTRTDFGHMTLRITFDDSKTYEKPWSTTIGFHLMPDTELIEDICENEKDHEHMKLK